MLKGVILRVNHLLQFRGLTDNFKEEGLGKLIKSHIPLMASLMPSTTDIQGYTSVDSGIWGFSALFHELGHCMDFVNRGQEHRLKLNNFGFKGRLSSRASLATEVRTTIFEHALEELILPVTFRGQNPTYLVMYDTHKLLSGLYRPFEGPSSEDLKRDMLHSYRKMSVDYISTLLAKVDKYVFEECKDLIHYKPFIYSNN